ncbi:MAG: hypothetical protein EON48_12205 [Acetobacteraceae bacterium]|nr:MAG: hypothetical protein EON48_12205 [Acetobacteraceae bacterium]
MSILKRATIATALVATLSVTAFAAELAPLAPGKPAGVQNAQLRPGPIAAIGIGAVVVGAVVLLSETGKATPPAVISTGTSP